MIELKRQFTLVSSRTRIPDHTHTHAQILLQPRSRHQYNAADCIGLLVCESGSVERYLDIYLIVVNLCN